jgi:DNA-binding XRE family transcriptional regulator
MKGFNVQEFFLRTCEIIKNERESRSLTQIQMAMQMGISQSALSKIENKEMNLALMPWLVFCKKFKLNPDLPLDLKKYRSWARAHHLDRKLVRKNKKILAN